MTRCGSTTSRTDFSIVVGSEKNNCAISLKWEPPLCGRSNFARLDRVLADLSIEGGQADPKPAGRLLLVEVGLGQNGQNVLALETAGHGPQPLAPGRHSPRLPLSGDVAHV